MGIYTIQVICFQAIFMVTYYVFLRKETFFTYNRLYLLVTLCISFIIPFLKIPLLQTAAPAIAFGTFLPEVIIGSSNIGSNALLANSSEGFQIPWLVLYVIGAVFSVAILGSKIYKLTKLFIHKKQGSRVIHVPGSKVAFTLFNYIFIGEEIDTLSRKQILRHEHVHVKQRHTWDLAFLEILRIVMWFNPLVYMFQKQLSILHEYLADKSAVQSVTKKEYYEELLNASFGTSTISFTNTFFNQSLIKKRIIMLQKSKSKKVDLVKYALIIPMLLGMLFYVSCSDDNGSLLEEDSKTEVMQRIDDLADAIMKKGNLNDQEIKALEFLAMPAEEGDRIYLSVDEYLKETANDEKAKEAVHKLDENKNISFEVIDEVPVFPGCESLSTNEERKICMSDKMSEMINQNFNIALGKDLGLTGVNRIFVSFKINKEGVITNLRSRSPHPDLDVEAQRVVTLLPKMKPGKHNGKEVGVLYSLPIAFKIAE